jgi:hypothetical protein
MTEQFTECSGPILNDDKKLSDSFHAVLLSTVVHLLSLLFLRANIRPTLCTRYVDDAHPPAADLPDEVRIL